MKNVKNLAIIAVSIALVYVATAFINIRLPFMANGGLIHLGNVPLFIVAMLYGKRAGAIAGGIGMGLFDLLSGWTAWAPFTLVIVGIMGYLVGAIAYKTNSNLKILLAMLVALVVKIVGYYIAEAIIYHNWLVPVSSIPGNIVQVVAAMIIVFPIIKILKKAVKNV
ncbi:MAG: ECF transporter S component [Lachnospira sp.]